MNAGAKAQVQEQFGANAAYYVDSRPHAQGASLARLVELVSPQPGWRVLDVATAAGHTALAFASHVAFVVGLDLTPQMLPLASGLAAGRGIRNVVFLAGDVDDLPFGDVSFDLVTCRIAPHHFPDIGRFVAEAVRVLRPGGLLAIADNVVPGSTLRGKKADRLRLAGEYVNAFEKLRDPSHIRCLSLGGWRDILAGGLALEAQETMDKRITFETWAARHSPQMRLRLRAMLMQAPAAAAEFLAPQATGDLTTFRLQEGLFVARRVAR